MGIARALQKSFAKGRRAPSRERLFSEKLEAVAGLCLSLPGEGLNGIEPGPRLQRGRAK